MKKLWLMIPVLAVLILAALWLWLPGGGGPLEIYGADGALMATLDETSYQSPETWPCKAYLELAVEEGIAQIRQLENCSREKAEKLLLTGGYRLHTAWDPKIQEALDSVGAEASRENPKVAMAVTDLQGRLVGVYSSETQTNFANIQTPPYSSFKPLSVYAPALELGKITGSTVFLDSPVKQVEGADWPRNATNTYSNEPVPVVEGIKHSLNTVAVRCMEELGLSESFRFLQERFGLVLQGEQNRAAALSEEDVMGNIAMGYLDYGVTPVQMAGFYQCFGNGGLYAEPKTLTELYRGEKCIYTYKPELQQVLTEENAGVMNWMLQQVVNRGSTGQEAYLEQIPVAGKTGTGDRGCWFVGVTPEYSCAVWHGNRETGNEAAALFAQAVSHFPHSSREFAQWGNLESGVYCKDSGGLATKHCRRVGRGIYAEGQLPAACNIEHSGGSK